MYIYISTFVVSLMYIICIYCFIYFHDSFLGSNAIWLWKDALLETVKYVIGTDFIKTLCTGVLTISLQSLFHEPLNSYSRFSRNSEAFTSKFLERLLKWSWHVRKVLVPVYTCPMSDASSFDKGNTFLCKF